MTLQEEKDTYYSHYIRFSRLPIDKLQRMLGELWKKRFVDNDINYATEHRVAARVYSEKTRKGDSLVFHLKNYIG